MITIALSKRAGLCACLLMISVCIELPAVTWVELLPWAAYGALGGAALTLVCQTGLGMWRRYNSSPAALKRRAAKALADADAADLKAKAAHEALTAKQAEVANRYAEEEARRGRQAIADAERRRTAFRAAGQRANQQEEEVQMRDFGESSASTPPSASPQSPSPNGELK